MYACSLCTVWVLSPYSSLFVVILCPSRYLVCLVLFCIPFGVFFYFFLACCMIIVCILVLSSPCHLYFTYNITWFDVWLFFFVFDITWCLCCRDYGLSFGGGSYSSVYVLPPMFLFPMILIICIPTLFLFFPFIYILYSYFLVHIAPGFTFSRLYGC